MDGLISYGKRSAKIFPTGKTSSCEKIYEGIWYGQIRSRTKSEIDL